MAELAVDEKAVFLAALALPEAKEREAYLHEACGDNPELLGHLRELLAAHEASQGPLDRRLTILGATAEDPLPERPGTVVGPYKLLEQIGEGGMGIVWMAQQTEPVKRLVALKLIKAGMDSKQVIARFEAERQALAIMDHPNIARVFDGGTALTGRPFFVMELVKGVPITEFCDQNHLSPRRRLELFIPVCQSVQHAHQKGIIHRDLKPSNVLVTVHDTTPVPKIIDFGVAKALGQELTDKTLFTGFAQMIGTPLYMSPEQAGQSGMDIDTRSDIYALGVLLYELLTGTTPFDKARLKAASHEEMRRIICEEEPPSPSRRISTLGQAATTASANRESQPQQLSRLLRGELDWIVMKALEKDRNRRYETANALAMDVQRYLADEPVLACPPSRWYRVRKFVRRHRAGLAVAGLVLFFLVLLGGGAGWTIRDRAVLSAQTTEKANESLAEAELLRTQGRWQDARAAIQRAQVLLASPAVDPIQQRRAEVLLADLEMAAELETIRLSKGGAKDDHFDESSADLDYARAFHAYGIDLDVLEAAEAAERIRARSIRVELAAALDDWAMVRRYALKTDEAKWKSLLALAGEADPDPLRNELRNVLERGDPAALQALIASDQVTQLPVSSLHLLKYPLERTRGGVAKTVALLRRARELHPGDFWINESLAHYLRHLNPSPLDERLRFLTAAAALHPQSPGAQLNLGNALLEKGLTEEALAVFDATLRLKPDWAFAHAARGQALETQGMSDAAVAAAREAIRLQPDLALAHNNLGAALRAKGLRDEAMAAYREAIRLKPTLAPPHVNLGVCLQEKGERDEAIAMFTRAIALQPAIPRAHYQLGLALGQKGDLDGAIIAYQGAIRHRPDYAEAHNNLGNALDRRGALTDAIASYRQAVRAKPDYALAYFNLGMALSKTNATAEETLAALKEGIRLRPDQAHAYFNLGNAHRKYGALDEAIAAYREDLRRNPNHWQGWNNLSITLTDKGLWDEAIVAGQEAVRVKPDYANGHYSLGNAFRGKRALDEAVAAYRNAIRLKPDFVLAHNNLGLVLTTMGNLEGGAAALKEALRLQPSCVEAHQNLGNLLAIQGANQEAKAAFREALRYRPDSADVLWCLAWQLVLTPNPPATDVPEALDLAQKATALTPRDPYPWQTLGLAHYRAGNWKASVSALDKAVALRTSKSDGKVWFLLAMVHFQLGNQQEARKWYQQGAAWMEENRQRLDQDPHKMREHRRFRAEADELMKQEPAMRNPESAKQPIPTDSWFLTPDPLDQSGR